MTNYTINNKLDRMAELETIIAELKKECDSLKDELKDEMAMRNAHELITDRYIARWTPVMSSRFDTKRFKAEIGEDIYLAYTKEVASYRWSVA